MPKDTKRQHSYDVDEFEVEYGSQYDRKMREQSKKGGCCSFYKFILFILFLGGALAVIFGFVDIEQIQNFFQNSIGGDGGTGGTGGDGDDGVVALPFMRCPENGDCCNGLETNCKLRVDEVFYASVHNANHDDILVPNHEAPLEEALEAGYRSLMLDVCKCEGEIVFCHSLCSVGTRSPSEVFDNINKFLESNPTEVVIINYEMSAGDPTPADIWSVMESNNRFKQKIYNHDFQEWPTLKELLDDDKQLIVFEHNYNVDCGQGGVGCVPRIEPFFSYAVETKWDFEDVASLENTAVSCAEDRGDYGLKDFYAVNGFTTGTFGPSKSSANIVNSREFIENHIKECEKLTKHEVNFYNIDFWQRGHLLQITQEINLERGKKRRSRFLRWFS